MIYPTSRAVILIVLAAPIALLIGAFLPGMWIVAPAFGFALLLLVLLDGAAAGYLAEARLDVATNAEVGAEAPLSLVAQFTGRRGGGRPQAALALDPRLAAGGRINFPLVRTGQNDWTGETALVPNRRGTGWISKGWLRWGGPLGLAWRQRRFDFDRQLRVWPNIGPVRSPALQIFLRDAMFGLIARKFRGEGTEFEALAEYEPGMDRRRIDWKSSARHARLFAKEYETERNNQIIFALDCGQGMCEPIDGLPRIDRAVTAALLTSYVALKTGDKVALFGFAARPEMSTPFIMESRNFYKLQEAAAGLDYRYQEPNFTLALTTLSSRLQRRSLIVLFTDFTDPTSAELMIENVGRLVEKHLVLFVVMQDAELEGLARARPDSIQEVSMAVTADALMRQRALVIRRLQHLGADVIEAPHDQIGTRLIDSYLRIKRRGRIG